MKKSLTIHRTRINDDIIAEFVVPPTKTLQKKGRVAIIAKGAPTMPGANRFLTFLAEQGFYAILPRYRGTWESGGKFLKNEPTKDIEEVIDALTKPLVSLYEGASFTFPKDPKIFIMAGSFGGPAGLFLSTDPRVTAVFAYAPVTDWRVKMKVEPLETFETDTKHLFGEGYRFDPKGVTKLLSGSFYNPAQARERIDGSKIWLFHAEDDTIVPIAPTKRLSEKVGARLIVFKTGGHGAPNHL